MEQRALFFSLVFSLSSLCFLCRQHLSFKAEIHTAQFISTILSKFLLMKKMKMTFLELLF